ncbi:uncharacterized protein MELLADRAFT_112656 [Melampsora larici-populina 98AG31]|uniref:Uncharacterized protein n=1 Tax=Melampsora larici-populina (strain 98AG31 / pathotype 3-4-7) TaxID=747676 RepID=F4S766_MELLP|nr:uncharacterized protein MELLADRAFT_112656 [Melampsora larici-populina 98AG31]EGF99523.1 hypothetical protein MELLADRAFT_112656 [Melampsora larici-populina 98AG31]
MGERPRRSQRQAQADETYPSTVLGVWISQSCAVLSFVLGDQTSMSAAPTSTQMSTSTPGASGKKRRLDAQADEEDDRNGQKETESSAEDSSDEGELTHEDLMERKRKRRANRKKLTEVRHRDKDIGKVADSHPIPKPATPIARAIYEFTRMVMGIPRRGLMSVLDPDACQKFPSSPTEEEQQAWLSRKQRRENFIRDAQDKAMDKYLRKKPEGFKPNRKQRQMVEHDSAEEANLKKPMRPVTFTSRIACGGRTRYAHHFGTQCEAALAMAGFPRCTFDWDGSWDSPWNSGTSSIILASWSKAYDANGAKEFGIISSDNTAANREEVLRRWFSNKGSKVREEVKHVDLMKTPMGREQMKEHVAKVQKRTIKKRNKEKIYEARLQVVERLFGKDSSEYAMISHPEVHSDEEFVSANTFATRQRLRLEWRRSELDTFIGHIDQAYWKRETLPKVRRACKQTVDRGAYAPDAEPDCFPPKGFQASLCDPTWLNSQEGLVLSELNLDGNNSCDIREAISDVMRTFRSRASLNDDSGVNSTGGASAGVSMQH